MLDALLARFSQNDRVLRLTTPLGEDVLLAESLRAEEGIGQGCRIELTALASDAGIALKSLLGQPVLVELLTSASRTSLRPFHGHVTACELLGSNGGMARYKLTIEPWTAFLALGRDSRVFQDKTVFDIIDAVFQAWDGKGTLTPAWRFDIADRGVYPQRSLCTQYQESDFAFVERLMSEEGLFHYVEHSADGHTLVIADHNGSFKPNAQADVAFTQPGAVMKADSIDRWRTELKMQTNAVDISSWDYRMRSTRAASATAGEAITLNSSDAPGAYAYETREQGQRIAENQLQALQAGKQIFVGAGTVRSFAPGTTFTLHGHATFDGGDSRFLIVRVRHLAHNNLSAEIEGALVKRLGQCILDAANLAELATGLHATGKGAGERPLYRNRIDAIDSKLPYRSSRTDGHGHLLHPRPTVRGQQSAIVVGPAGVPVHTDRDHRIKVQFHWQRGDASHSRLPHPAPDGHSGAPADDGAGTWVRVATPLAPVAGENWGSHALPRIGQEVLIDFMDGDIDRPVVIGALYNGVGQLDAQHNKVAQGAGAATGNANPWFPGDAGAHAHPAALSGIKTQAMQASQGGSGAYSQLVFDDTPGEARLALQRHAGAHQGTDELNLGHLRHQSDNQRLAPAGFGAELKTAHSAALRAGQGMLLATDNSAGVNGSQLDARAAHNQIKQSQQLQTSLATTAQEHNARLAQEAAPDKLPAIVQLGASAASIAHSSQGDGGESGGHGVTTAFGTAQLQLSSPAGIIAATPASAIFSAGITSSLTAGHDLNFAAQGNALHSVTAGISLFTYGKAGSADKPNKETGLRLHAASGKFSAQSQSDATRLTADKKISVTSTAASVSVAAKQHVLMTAQGAWIKLDGGNIEVHGPGIMAFKASMKELTGPKASSPKLPPLPGAGKLTTETPWIEIERLYYDGTAVHGAPYKITFADGSVRKGTLDDKGQARVEGVKRGAAKIEIGEDAREWQIEEPDEQIANPAFGKKLTPEQLIELGKLYSSVNN